MLTLHFEGRSGPVVARPLLAALAAVRESNAIEYAYPADGLAAAIAAPPRRRKSMRDGGKEGQTDGGTSGSAQADSVLQKVEVPPALRVARATDDASVTPQVQAGPALPVVASGAPEGGSLGEWFGIRWRALAAVVLMVSGWLLLASGARYVLLRWSGDPPEGYASSPRSRGYASTPNSAEPLLSARTPTSVETAASYTLPKNLRRQLCGGRSRLGDARSTPGSLPLIQESRESEEDGTASEGSGGSLPHTPVPRA